MNSHCANLFYLSALACKISECLTDDELSVLAADLTVLADMLSSVSARQSVCDEARE